MISSQIGTFLMRSPAVLWRNVGQEVALAQPGREDFQMLSPTGASVWRLLDEPRTYPELIDRLVSEYHASPKEIGPDVDHLLEDLIHQGLVQAVADGDD